VSDIELAREDLANLIRLVRGYRVMLDSDLASLYNTTTSRLLEAVRRQRERFPDDFMFQLTAQEHESLRSQNAISNVRGGRRYLPYVFTEHGVAMLSSVLNSPRAVQVNIEIVRAFVRLRHLAVEQDELVARLDALEARYDAQFKTVFDALRALMAPPPAPQRKLGFREEAAEYSA
jgi:hypothetical protein